MVKLKFGSHLGKTYYQSYLELSKIVNICENFSLKRPSSKHGGPINNILNIKIKMPTIYFNFMIHTKMPTMPPTSTMKTPPSCARESWALVPAVSF